MPHAIRSAQRANTKRRNQAAKANTPLSLEEQQKRATARAKHRNAEYPYPPYYDPMVSVRGDDIVKE